MAQLQGLGQPPSQQVLEAHIQNVRLFMRDFTQLNRLIRGEESDDRMIAWATMDFLSDFNGTPPFSSFTLDDMVARNLQHLAVRGTVVTLLQSLMLLYGRNNLPFSDGGLSVNLDDKAPLIQSMLSLVQAAYEQNKMKVKIAINIEGIMDTQPSGVHSDYLVLAASGYY